MGRSIIMNVVSLTLATVILAGGSVAVGAEPSTAPRNPEFVQYLHRAVARAAKATSEEEYSLGAIPSPVDMSHTAGQEPPPAAAAGPGVPAGAPPTSYDLRSLGLLPPVRDQGTCGSCWTFATYGSMESCLLTVPETWDFSEMDLACENGFDYTQCFGGQCWMSTAYLARWDGPMTETCYPYSTPPNYNCTVPRPSCAVQKHIQVVDFIPDRADTTIKNAIMYNGAVYTTMYWDASYYNSATYSYYYNGAATLNHAVCIVGWDDNYATSNFNSTPPGPGAFIIRNSWGAGWGQSGYFYISYHDTKIGRDNALFHNAESTTNYLTRYDYDPLGWVSTTGFSSPTAWCANIFTAVASEDLAAVTAYAVSTNATYDLYVYTNVTGGPTSGTLATGYPQSGSFASPGYRRIVLGTPVSLTNGQKFSIVLKLTTPGYNYPIAHEEPLAGYSSAATANAGESYISSDGSSWTDITTSFTNSNVCIKGFTVETPPPMYIIDFSLDIGSDTEQSDVNVNGNEGFDPGDMYLGGPFFSAGPWYTSVTPSDVVGGRDGYKDDAIIFFSVAITDPPPVSPDLGGPSTTDVPIGNDLGVNQYLDYLDIDAHDQIHISLQGIEHPMNKTAGPCIYDAQHLYISYDDDQAMGWSMGPLWSADVPVIAPSSAGISSYGGDSNWDELLGLTVTPGGPVPFVLISPPAGIADEKEVHPDLKPDPTVSAKNDDDVDSLDIIEYNEADLPEPGQSTCPYWLFSVDHEATMGLDPGDIYEINMSLPPQIMPVMVVHHFTHLGLPDGVDIDAFEFVWAPMLDGPTVLALLFSVDEDDPLTTANESGGLMPDKLYLSYMTGTYQEFLTESHGDDIDALSNWSHGIASMPDSQPPALEDAHSVKTHGTVGTFQIDLLARLNGKDIECRQYGVTRAIIKFDEDIQRVNNDLTDVTLTSGTLTAITQSGAREVTIDMTGTTNGVPLTVSFPGIADADDINLIVTDTLCIRQLIGDARPDLVINVFDRLDVRNQMIYPVSTSNFRMDVRNDGIINVFDRLDVRNAMGTSFVGSCP